MKKDRSGRKRPARDSVLRSGPAGIRRPEGQDDRCHDRSGADVAESHVIRREDHHASPGGRHEATARCVLDHEWVVFSTTLQEGWLMLQCVECGAMGTIDDPSPEEWSAAFHAPSRPYRWHEPTRVTVRGHAAPRVIRAVGGPACDCPSQLSLPPRTGYERVPGGIWAHPGSLSDGEKSELLDLAEFVVRTDLCSHLLPLFARSFERHSGRRHSGATRTILDRIERWDERGIHCSPSAVARIIREFAAWDPR